MEIDELIKQVKQKAQELENEQTQEFQAVVLDTVLAEAESDNLDDQIFHLNDFLFYEHQKFLTMAYRVVLKRQPDEVGLESSLRYLNKGGSRQSLLADMMLSDEGLKHPVVINGMQWPIFRSRWIKRLGYVGRMLKPLAVLPDHIFKPRLTPTIRKLLDLEQQNINNRKFFAKQSQQYNQVSQQHHDGIRQQYDILKQQYDNSIKQNEQLLQQLMQQNENLMQQNQQLENSQAEVRMQFNYQQRNHDAFLQELLNASYAHGEDQPSQQEIPAQVLAEHKNDKLDAYYVAFEDACRGSRAEIRENLAEYLPHIRNTINTIGLAESETPIITDLGCGRGEWLELLSEQGWQAKGLDLNKVMVQDCRAKGMDVTEGDVIDYLSQQESHSLTAVTAFHIIEHLPFSSLLALFEESIRCLKPGGMIIFETPNPENVLVGSHTFYHDPTHRNPITPTSVQFLARYTGFCQIEIVRLHPYPVEARVPGNEPVTERVNGHLCGPQDYAIIAHKPQ